ncbi:MAG: glycoside hydrolase family 73 protein [Arenibacterium sp.]
MGLLDLLGGGDGFQPNPKLQRTGNALSAMGNGILGEPMVQAEPSMKAPLLPNAGGGLRRFGTALMSMGAGFQGNDPYEVISRHQAGIERAQRKEKISNLMGDMGLGQQQRDLLETLPLESQQEFLLGRVMPSKPEYRTVGDRLLRIGPDGNVSLAYGQERMGAQELFDSTGGSQNKNRGAFIQQITPYAETAAAQLNIDPRIVIAQAALETGWGRSAPGNNFFGIKSHGKPGGNTLATKEVIEGQTVSVNDSFRAYGSMGESVQGYVDFLKSNPRYQPMLQAEGLEAQVAALGASGYATDPDYASKILSIANSIGGSSPQPTTPSTLAEIDKKISRWTKVLGDSRLDDRGEARAMQEIENLQLQRRELVGDSRTTEKEDQIRRLVSIGVPREEAIAIADGLRVVTRDPITQEAQIIDRRTGGIVGQIPEPQAPTATDGGPALTYGDRFQNAQSAFGVGSAVRGAVNTVADTIGAPVPFPQTQDAQSEFSVFREGLVNTFASAYGRQPPSWLLKKIDELAPQPGSVWEGPAKAQSKLRALANDLTTRRDQLEKRAARKMSPTARQDIDGQISGIDALLDEMRSALGGFTSEGGGTTATGLNWSLK